MRSAPPKISAERSIRIQFGFPFVFAAGSTTWISRYHFYGYPPKNIIALSGSYGYWSHSMGRTTKAGRGAAADATAAAVAAVPPVAFLPPCFATVTPAQGNKPKRWLKNLFRPYGPGRLPDTRIRGRGPPGPKKIFFYHVHVFPKCRTSLKQKQTKNVWVYHF